MIYLSLVTILANTFTSVYIVKMILRQKRADQTKGN